MKRSNVAINFEETNRKEIRLTASATTSQVMITLDETIGSSLLYRKFKYQTSEFQLFLQHVPVLLFYPLDIIGTTTFDMIDACIFSAAMRNNFHDYTYVMVESMANLDFDNDEIETKKLKRLLKGLLEDELFILQALGEYREEDQDDGMDYSNPLEYISDQLKEDEKFMLKAIKINGHSMEYLSDRLKDNEQFITQSSKLQNYDSSSEYEDSSDDDEDISVSSYTSEQGEKENLFEAIKFGTLNDEQFVTKAIKINIYALEYASDRLKDNEEIVLQAIKQNGDALKFASKRLQDNEQIVLATVKQDGNAIKHATKRLKDNEEIVSQAVGKNAHALAHASKRLRDDKEIVLKAVRENGISLQYASKRLQDNEEIVLEAAKRDCFANYYSSNRLKDDEQFILKLVKQNGYDLLFASNRLQDNEIIVMEAVKTNGHALKYAPDRLKDNENIVLEAIKHSGLVLEHASDRLKDNEEIVLLAAKQNSNSLKYASKRLRNDFNFANEIFKYCTTLEVFEYFGEELRNIEFIYYFIENYQSKFHELMRKNTKAKNSNVLSSLKILSEL